jgi:hypothetical protein
MKRFLLFYGSDYYPRGGWDDLASSFDSLQEALEYVATKHCDWYQVIDMETRNKVSGR